MCIVECQYFSKNLGTLQDFSGMPHTRSQSSTKKQAQANYYSNWYSKHSNKEKKRVASKVSRDRKKLQKEKTLAITSKLERTVSELKAKPSEQVILYYIQGFQYLISIPRL